MGCTATCLWSQEEDRHLQAKEKLAKMLFGRRKDKQAGASNETSTAAEGSSASVSATESKSAADESKASTVESAAGKPNARSGLYERY